MSVDSIGPIFVVLIVAALVIAAGAYSYFEQKKRREVLAALAAELGWRFDPEKDSFHDQEYAHFEIFRRGHSRYAYNTLAGEVTIKDRPYPAKMGDFTYKVTSGSGKNRKTTTYRFSYLIVHLPYSGTPNLLIRPEGVFDKIAGAFGFDDIDFESAEFSRKFHVKSEEKRFAYDVCHPRMMEFLLHTRPPAVDIEHGKCCLSDGTGRWTPEQFKSTAQWVSHFFDRWPEHVITELQQRN
jgi:hypothetical protein